MFKLVNCMTARYYKENKLAGYSLEVDRNTLDYHFTGLRERFSGCKEVAVLPVCILSFVDEPEVPVICRPGGHSRSS